MKLRLVLTEPIELSGKQRYGVKLQIDGDAERHVSRLMNVINVLLPEAVVIPEKEY